MHLSCRYGADLSASLNYAPYETAHSFEMPFAGGAVHHGINSARVKLSDQLDSAIFPELVGEVKFTEWTSGPTTQLAPLQNV